jgi:hypothetical protein
MGGACQSCRTSESLEFDCYPVPDTAHHYFPSPQRMRFYWQQFLKNNLRLLCKRCHQIETAKMNSKSIHSSLRFFSPLPFLPIFVSRENFSRAQTALADGGVPFEVPSCADADTLVFGTTKSAER